MEQTNQIPGILIVDDEKSIRDSIYRVLVRENFSVFQADGAAKAVELLEKEKIGVVLCDLFMPEIDGMQLLRQIKQNYREVEVLIISAHASIEKAVDAVREGAYDFISKPFKRMDIIQRVNKALEKREISTENRMLKKQVTNSGRARHPFIGKSAEIRKILKNIEQVAPTQSTVLIMGESGTGKEILARLIHTKSSRADKPFIAINCGAITESLIESELFGHLKGSFTGAHNDRDGLFKIANGGTLFLDEICTIPKNIQIKLLRALEEREIMPVGSTRAIPIDVRLIAACNQDILRAVAKNQFREDLYYRLNVFDIQVPPLQERQEDIPLLVEYYIQHFNREMHKNIRGISERALNLLRNNVWKGNVRELRNVIERAMIICPEEIIDSGHLSLPAAGQKSEKQFPGNLKESVIQFEKRHISKMLTSVKGDKKAAANLLGLSLSSLYRKMTELGLQK